MKDKLSYKQLYNELETLNASAYDSLLNEDFEQFQNSIDEFIASGIMEQEEFASAREAYRYASTPFTLDGIWISVDSHNPLDIAITDLSGLDIKELNKRDVQPIYAYLTEQEKTNLGNSKFAPKMITALEQYKELYKNLYKSNRQNGIFSIPLIDDPHKHQMTYIERITELASVRSKSYMTYDFSCLPIKNVQIIDNAKLKAMSIPEKMKYLTQAFSNLFNQATNKNTLKATDCFSFNGFEKVLASNYIHAKGIDRKHWKYYTKGILPNMNLFYLELAFYLTIPSSDEIETFMNLHGYSIKSPITHFHDIYCGKKVYHILHSDLCRWIDAGIDYNLINEICGFQLQQKEIRKPKTN